nr:hypothetical protein [uncultured Niameybacter sp.]
MNLFEDFTISTIPRPFPIVRNTFLKQNITGYYNRPYTGYGNLDNPAFINILKNTFNKEPIQNLNTARKEVEEILKKDLPKIMYKHNFTKCVCVCIPRAKSLNSYSNKQLYFIQAVRNVSNSIPGLIDGSGVIIRHTDTCTTHLAKASSEGRLPIPNDGAMPYPGITQETCYIQKDIIKGNKIILIDDIYTNNVNIDEDCIQALLNNGANEVVFYAIGKTGGY